MLKTMETMYGPKLVVYVTQVQDKLVYTFGYDKEDGLKAQIDKLLDHKPATSSVPPRGRAQRPACRPPAAGMAFIETAEMVKNFGSVFMGQMNPEVKKKVDDLKFDKPSGVGMCVVAAQKGFIIYCNVPMQRC